MSEKINLFELDFDIAALTKSTSEALSQMNSLVKAQADLKKQSAELKTEIKNYSDALKEAEKNCDASAYDTINQKLNSLKIQYSNNSDAIAANASAITAASKEYQTGATTIDSYAKSAQKTGTSINDLSANIKKNEEAYNALSAEERENADIGGQLQTTIASQKAQYESLQSSIEATSATNNSYQKGLDSVKAATNAFSGSATSVISNFINISKQEGGLKGFFKSTVSGIWSMIKASLSFIATPIGAILAALAVTVGVVKAVFSSFTPVLEKIEQLSAGVSAAFSALKEGALALFTGQKNLGESFKDLGKNMSEAAKAGMELKKAEQELDKMTVLNIEHQAKYKTQIDELILQSKDKSKSEKERAALANQALEVEKQAYKEEKEIADKGVDIALNKIIVGRNLTDEQIKRLKEGGVAAAQELQNTKDIKKEEIQAFTDALAAQQNVIDKGLSIEEKAQDQRNQLLDKAAEQEKKRLDDVNKAKEKSLENQRTTLNKELKSFEDQNKSKLKFDVDYNDQSVAEEKTRLETVYNKQVEYLNKDFDAQIKIAKLKGEDTEKIEGQRTQALTNLENNYQKSVEDTDNKYLDVKKTKAENAIAIAAIEIDNYINNNQSKLQSDADYNDQSVADEQNRLLTIYNMQKDQLTKEWQLKIDNAKALGQDTSLLEAQKNQALIKLGGDYLNNVTAVNNSYKDAVKDRVDFEAKYTADANENQWVAKQKSLDDEKAAAIKAAKEKGASVKVVEDYYAKQQKKLDREVNNAKLAAVSDTLGNISGLFEENTVAYKVTASAQALINTYLSASQAYYSTLEGIPGAVGIALAPINAAVAVAAGLKQVAEINNIGTKAEDGIALNIGGHRHAQGGTKFYGTDGTRFEAEKGETMFVLNRLASSRLAPYLSSLNVSSGGRPLWHVTNHLASGGTVAQSSSTTTVSTTTDTSAAVDYDTLASKIASAIATMPSPVVSVVDIINKSNRYVEVVNGANL